MSGNTVLLVTVSLTGVLFMSGVVFQCLMNH